MHKLAGIRRTENRKIANNRRRGGCRYEQAIDKTARTDCVCSGAQRAPCRPRVWWHDRRPHTPCRGRRPRRPVTHRRNQQAADKTRMPPNCHCEEAAGRRGNLGKALTISPIAFPQFSRVLRDCTPRALPRASRSGRHVASLLAMTKGACHFNGGQYGL